jgi:hypothetical protein
MFVGFIRPYLTSIPMLSELQSRWVAKVICDKVTLPSTQYMNDENVKDDLKQQVEFACSYDRLHTIVDPYDYCNMIADNIGAQLNMSQLIFENPYLLYMILVGSWNHHVYRLNDPDEEKRAIAIKNIKMVYGEKISVKIKSILFHSIYSFIFNIILAILVIYAIIYFYHKSIKKFSSVFLSDVLSFK